MKYNDLITHFLSEAGLKGWDDERGERYRLESIYDGIENSIKSITKSKNVSLEQSDLSRDKVKNIFNGVSDQIKTVFTFKFNTEEVMQVEMIIDSERKGDMYIIFEAPKGSAPSKDDDGIERYPGSNKTIDITEVEQVDVERAIRSVYNAFYDSYQDYYDSDAPYYPKKKEKRSSKEN